MTTSSGPDGDTCNCILNLLQTVLLCRCKFPEGTDAEIQPWHSESLEFNVPSAAHEYLTTIIGGSCHKSHFCRDKSLCLSRQNTSFVATKVCLPRQNCVFVATNVLWRQTYFCRDQNYTCGSSRQRCTTTDLRWI